jgi:hypothetical protein
MSVFTRILHGLEATPDPSETLSERLPAITAVLKRQRVCRVRVRYDGRYDLRSVEAPMWLTALGSVFEPGVPATVRWHCKCFLPSCSNCVIPAGRTPKVRAANLCGP